MPPIPLIADMSITVSMKRETHLLVQIHTLAIWQWSRLMVVALFTMILVSLDPPLRPLSAQHKCSQLPLNCTRLRALSKHFLVNGALLKADRVSVDGLLGLCLGTSLLGNSVSQHALLNLYLTVLAHPR